jgi:PAS domain S-box-containing protein
MQMPVPRPVGDLRTLGNEAVLYRFTDRLYRAQSQSEVFEAALDAITEALGCKRASVLLFDAAGVMRFVAWRGLSESYRKAVDGHSPWNPGDRDPTPIFISDIDAADFPASLKAVIKGEGIRALGFFPLAADGVAIGKFMTYYEAPHVFDDSETGVALTIARQLGFSIERHRVEAAREAAEERLRRNHDTFYNLIQNNPFGVYVVDAEFRLAQVSLGSQKVFSSVRPLIGRDFAEVLRTIWAEPFATEAIGRFRHTLETGEPYSSPSTVERRQDIGEVEAYDWRIERIVLPDGRYGVVCYFYDLSERQRWEGALRESERKLQTLVGNLPGVAYRRPVEKPWPLSYASEGVFELTGYAPHDLTQGRVHWAEIIAAEDIDQVSSQVGAALAERRMFETVYRINRADGSQRWVLDRGRGIYADGDDRPVAIEGFVGDITAQREAESELRRLNTELESRVALAVSERETALRQLHEIQKLEILGQITGGVAHDFNNLLTPIVGGLDLLRTHVEGDARAARLVDNASQAADRARTLIQRLLSFGRRQLLRPQAVDVSELVRGMADLIQRSLGPQIDMAIEAPDGMSSAKIDPNQLELAILNLCVNARDAMPNGGRLAISVTEERLGPDHPSKLAPGVYIRLSVIDTGSGMDAHTLGRAVEPFFSTKGAGRGTGLGLSMVHGLAAQSGGALLLSSEIGAGTRVELWLPTGDKVAALPPSADDSPATPFCDGTILLVDDEELARSVISEMLMDLGYRVVPASSGRQALELLDAHRAIDLVITDYLMPGTTGKALIQELRQRHAHLPVLLVTGYAAVTDIPAGVPRLVKPFLRGELARSVSELLASSSAGTGGRH